MLVQVVVLDDLIEEDDKRVDVAEVTPAEGSAHCVGMCGAC